MSSLDTDELRVREETLKKLHADAERYLAEYTRQFGNILNADNAATLFEEYNLDRAKYREAVHPAATWIRDELFRRALEGKPVDEKNRVVFTAGSNAAGKSTALSFTDERARAHVIFDSTFSNPVHARRLVDQVLGAGKRITVLYIHRTLADALFGMLERASEEGRVVTIHQMVNSYRGAAESVRALWQDFGNDTRAQFGFVENSGESPRRGNIESAAPKDYTEIRKHLYEILDAEYQSGHVTKEVYRRVRGRGYQGKPHRRGPNGDGSD